MRIRTYKIITLTLAGLLIWVTWKNLSLKSKIFTANCVVLQADHLREVNTTFQGSKDCDTVLHELDWYVGYYDRRTNALAGSGLLGLLRRDRESVVRETIAYLRKNGTNDFGEDPYQWLNKEHVR